MKQEMMVASTKWQFEEDMDTLLVSDKLYGLIVWNDEVNTFDWVIESLVDICEHTEEQAHQCALIIHHRGKYTVKIGDFDTLKPKAEALIDRGIQATINS